MSTQFYVGEQPSDPLVITIHDEAGAPVDLSDVSSVALVGGILPDGELDISNAAEGKVQYTFNEPFTLAGVLDLQVQMVDSAEGTDYSAPFQLVVSDPADIAMLLVTAGLVELWTGTPVSEANIARAQGSLCLVLGRDLSDAAWLTALGTSDNFWLRQAIAYQAAYLASVDNIGALTPGAVPGAISVANGDVSVTWSDTSVAQAEVGPVLSPSAQAAVRKLTWMRPNRTMYARPYLDDVDRYLNVADLPTMWHDIYRTPR